jgi:hypothetical protein
MDASWVVDIRNQCQRAKVPFFFKQWGGLNRKKTGRKLEGRTWDEIPLAAGMTKAVGKLLRGIGDATNLRNSFLK